MTTLELIKQANENATAKSEAYQNLIDTMPRKEAYSKWNEIHGGFSNQSLYGGIICESTVCFKGATMYFQNRFYVIKSNGMRGAFSKAKAISALG